MRKWFVGSVFALSVLGSSVNAQPQEVQVQVVQGQAQPAQIQIAIDPAENMARALIAPGFGVAPRAALGKADAIVVGRVVAIEPMDVDASPAPGQPNAKYRIAVVQVTESIHGI